MTSTNTNGSSAQQGSSPMANVRFGVYTQPAPVAGKSVKDIREQFSKLWGIPSDAIAYKGKDHQEVIAATSRNKWYREELFARFSVREMRGEISN